MPPQARPNWDASDGASGVLCKRTVLVALILRQVKADPPDLMPLRGALLQERCQSLCLHYRLVYPLVQGLPDRLQHLIRQIFATGP